MFYCDECATKHGWHQTFARSFGNCEMCRKTASCNDGPGGTVKATPKTADNESPDLTTLDREALARMVGELQGERDYLLECQADKRRLTRLLDEAISGEGNAAEQASLCDLVEPARRLREERDRLAIKFAEAQLEIAVDDTLLTDRDRLLAAIPQDAHGPCMPNAIQWIERMKQVEAQLAAARAEASQLQRRLEQTQGDLMQTRNALDVCLDDRNAARVEVDRLTAADNPEYDATDAASPAWWRGHDHTTKVFCALVNDILDGKDDGSGANREPWASTRKRLLGLCTEKLKWKRRANLFHEAYKEKDFESFALNLQKMQLEASGADVILPWQNRSLRARLLDTCKERNRLRAALAQVGERVRAKAIEIAIRTLKSGRDHTAVERAVSDINIAAIVAASAETASAVRSDLLLPYCPECNEEKNLAYLQTNAEAEEWLCKTCRHRFQFKPPAEE